MYYIISILLIVTAIGLAIYGYKKYNISLALAYVIPNLAFLYYIDEAFNGVPYIKYGYYTVLVFGLLVLLFAKIFTYIYAYFTLLFLIVLIWASLYSIFDLNPENLSTIESWSIILIAIVVLVLVRKSIKRLVIGMGSGYMLGIGIAALGFKSILNMGWGYIMDAIYIPGLTILLFTFAGISYQYYLNKSNEENPTLSKKQVNLYFGAGSGIIAVLLIILPLLLTTTPEKSAKKLAKAYCGCIEEISNYDNESNIEELCKDKIGYDSALNSISSFDDITIFSTVFAKEISNCLEDIAQKENNTIVTKQQNIKQTNQNNNNSTSTDSKNENNNSSQNENYNRLLGRYIGDFGMDSAILVIENIDVQNGIATGYIKTLGEYEDTQTLKGPFMVVNGITGLRIALSDNYTTYDFYIEGKTLVGNAKDQNGEIQYSFLLSKTDNTSPNRLPEKTYYVIQDLDGYSNLRNKPNGEIVKTVYDSEKFEVIGSEGKYKKVKLKDGTIGYIHASRVVKVTINSKNIEDFPNENIETKIVQIRERFKTINSNISDYKKVEKDIVGQSSEGGTIVGFSLKGNWMKIVKTDYGEMGKTIGEYYYWNNSLFFLFNRVFHYDSPISNMNSKTKRVDENRYYINNNRIIKWLNPEKVVVDNSLFSNKQVEIFNISRYIKNELTNENSQTILLQTSKYKIKIDDLGNDNYTYTAWPASSSMNDTPNLVIKGGERIKDGRGGNHYYLFTNGKYKYECWINIIGTDETPPANLLVYKNNDLILSEDAIIK
ncbi:MAG: SH3 domain-containing protein [Flavobacteriaceae bacterium]|nr:SH3 domain-containing protein [Flavobacteriaceae bacterium]